jgi:hypothetical protein
MKKVLFFLALIGWTLALMVYIVSLIGVDIADKIPFIWLIHVGVFIVWLPTVLLMRKNEEIKQANTLKRMNPVDMFKIMFKGTPTWLVYIAIGGFAYGIIHFLFFMSLGIGVTGIIDGQYVLHNHGDVIKTLTEGEYHQYKAKEMKLASGQSIIFYGMAAAVLYPFRKRRIEKLYT